MESVLEEKTVDDSDAVSHVSDTTIGSPIRHVGDGLFSELKRCGYNEPYSDDMRISPTIPDQDQSTSHKIASTSETYSSDSESLLLLKDEEEKTQDLDDHFNVIKICDEPLRTYSPFSDFDSEINPCHKSLKPEAKMNNNSNETAQTHDIPSPTDIIGEADLLATKTQMVPNEIGTQNVENPIDSNIVSVNFCNIESITEVEKSETPIKAEETCDAAPLGKMLTETNCSNIVACIIRNENPTDLDYDTEPNPSNYTQVEVKNINTNSDDLEEASVVKNDNDINTVNCNKNVMVMNNMNIKTTIVTHKDTLTSNNPISEKDNTKKDHSMNSIGNMQLTNDTNSDVAKLKNTIANDVTIEHEQPVLKNKHQSTNSEFRNDEISLQDCPVDGKDLTVQKSSLLMDNPLYKESNVSLPRGSPLKAEDSNAEANFNQLNKMSVSDDELLDIIRNFGIHDDPRSKDTQNLLVIDTQVQNNTDKENHFDIPFEKKSSIDVKSNIPIPNCKAMELPQTNYDQESELMLNASQSSISTINPADLYNYVQDIDQTSTSDNLLVYNEQSTSEGTDRSNVHTTNTNKAENTFQLQPTLPKEPNHYQYAINPNTNGQADIMKNVSFLEKPIGKVNTLQFFEQNITPSQTMKRDELLNREKQKPLKTMNDARSESFLTTGLDPQYGTTPQTSILSYQTTSKLSHTGLITTDEHAENSVQEGGSESLLLDDSRKSIGTNMQSINTERSPHLHQNTEKLETLQDDLEFPDIATEEIVNILDIQNDLEENTNVEIDVESAKSKRSNELNKQILEEVNNEMTANVSNILSMTIDIDSTPLNATINTPKTDNSTLKKSSFSPKVKEPISVDLQRKPFVPPFLKSSKTESKNIDVRKNSLPSVTSTTETPVLTTHEPQTNTQVNKQPDTMNNIFDGGDITEEERKEDGEGISKTGKPDLRQTGTHTTDESPLRNVDDHLHSETPVTAPQKLNETLTSSAPSVENGPRRSNRVSREPERLISCSEKGIDDKIIDSRQGSIEGEHSLENTRHLQSMATYDKLKTEYDSIEEKVADVPNLTTDVVKQCSKAMKEAQKRLMNYLSFAKAEATFLTSQTKVTTLPKDLKALLKTKLKLLSERQKRLKSLYSTHCTLQSRIKSLTSRKFASNKVEAEKSNDLMPPAKKVPLGQSTLSNNESSKGWTNEIECINQERCNNNEEIGNSVRSKEVSQRNNVTESKESSQSATGPIEVPSQVLTAKSENRSYVLIPMYKQTQPLPSHQINSGFIQQNCKQTNSTPASHVQQVIVTPKVIKPPAINNNIPVGLSILPKQTIRIINAPLSQIKHTSTPKQNSTIGASSTANTIVTQPGNKINLQHDAQTSTDDDDILDLILNSLDRESAPRQKPFHSTNLMPLDLSKTNLSSSSNNNYEVNNVNPHTSETQNIAMKRKSNEILQMTGKRYIIGADQNIQRCIVNEQHSIGTNEQGLASQKAAFKVPTAITEGSVTTPASVTLVHSDNLENIPVVEKETPRNNNSPSPSVVSFTSGNSSSSRLYLKKMKDKALKINQAKLKRDYQQSTKLVSQLNPPIQRVVIHPTKPLTANTFSKAPLLIGPQKPSPVIVQAQSNATQTAIHPKCTEATRTSQQSTIISTSYQSVYKYPTIHDNKVSEYCKAPAYPSLKAMLKMGLIKPGKNRLAIKYLRRTFLGTLLESGTILDSDAHIFDSPMKWFKHVTGSSSCRKATAYKKVYFDGRSLNTLIQEYEKNSDTCSISSWNQHDSNNEKKNSDVANTSNILTPAENHLPLCNTVKHTVYTDGTNGDKSNLTTMSAIHLQDNIETIPPIQSNENKSTPNPLSLTFVNILLIDDREIICSTELDDEFWKKPFKDIVLSDQFWNDVDNWN